MSEYQYVAFRAIDRPLTDEELEYMEEQSTRAEITKWSFDNEYHFGDFGGDANEMLRRGYDFHFHYANFGYRSLFFRLSNGFPNGIAASEYLDDESLIFIKDKKGRGGILCIEPFYEPDHLDQLWDPEDWVDALIPLREEILNGDLRPLYIAHLAVSCDGNNDPAERREAPVPAGLKKPTEAQLNLAALYEITPAVLSAAAKNSPALPKTQEKTKQYESWLKTQSQDEKDSWLLQLLSGRESNVRSEILTKMQQDRGPTAWPTAPGTRTVQELLEIAEGIEKEEDRKAQEKAEREHRQRLEKMKADPKPFLHEAEKLVDQGGRDSYEEAAVLLAELRDALAGTPKSDLADEHAKKLREKVARNSSLVGIFRKQGFLPKK